jgi:hypothetical protein
MAYSVGARRQAGSRCKETRIRRGSILVARGGQFLLSFDKMIGRHLRDGHRMLFTSGTDGALIDPSDGREKRFRLRSRAFHALVKVHFSRFCPLTIVASGASLFAFDGAATHHPPRSVTDTEQPLIVAHRAAICCAPRRGRSATNAEHRRPRARPPRLRLAGRGRRR